MGASIRWRLIGAGKDITPGARSDFISALQLNEPRRFTKEDFSWLRGLMAGRPDFTPAITEMVQAIEQHGTIEVYAVY